MHTELHKPVIIMGMHRSGTSMLAQVLHQSGIHMGVHRDHNFEALHFLSINQRAMWQAGGDWHMPVVPAEQCFDTWSAQELFYIHLALKKRYAYLKYVFLNQRWGWKDPRNTFTLPHWLRLFPEAKVVHLIRHGWDVAISLKNRNQKTGEVYVREFDDLQVGFQLWSSYLNQAFSYDISSIIHLKYEDLIALNPIEIQRLEGFLNVKIKDQLKNVVQKTNRSTVRYPETIRNNEWIQKIYGN